MSIKVERAFSLSLVAVALVATVVAILLGIRIEPRAPSRAADDRRFCDAYCNAAKGDLVEMHNTPSTDSSPAAPICVCAIGEPAIDVD